MKASSSIFEKYICSCIYHFFFDIDNEYIHKCLFQEFVVSYIIPCIFSKIMKALALVEVT